VIIVGSGQAGMFTAYELVNGKKDLKILVIDRGKAIDERACPMKETGVCVSCKPCEIMCGVGGAGTFSDGTLNIHPGIGGDLEMQTGDQDLAWNLVDLVDKLFVKFGAPKKMLVGDDKAVYELKKRSSAAGIKFVDIRQRHIGSDNAPKVIGNFERYLKKKGVEFLLETKVTDLIIENGRIKGVKTHKKKIYGDYVLIAPGRVGADWVSDIVKKHKIRGRFGPIDIGVRVEVPSIIMDSIVEINRDPKFHIWTTQYGDFVRTFCTNHEGFVVKENYDDFIGVNGHSLLGKKSENTNFAFLVRTVLTEPLEDTTRYGKSISKLSTTVGGGRPIVQRLGDLRRGRRSTWARLQRSTITNTLRDVTPGNVAMVLPHKILTDVLEGLEKLDEVIHGVASDSTLIYAPEVKFYSRELVVDKSMETSIKNLFAAGDGAGLSRDIVNASATGILAARGMLKKIG